MESGSRKRSSSVRSEQMERFGDRKKMEGYCSTDQSAQRAVVPVEEYEQEEEEEEEEEEGEEEGKCIFKKYLRT
jgi:hypothetical protein